MWRTFLEKAKLVRTLRDSSFGGGYDLPLTSVGPLATSRPVITIFPHLRVLCMSSHHLNKLVMSPSVEVLNWKVGRWMDDSREMWEICQSVVDRMPNIRSLNLDFENALASQSQLAFLCAQLEQLETLRIPLYGLTPTLICGLSGLPKLKEIEFMIGEKYSSSSGSNTVGLNDFQTANVHLSSSAFAALRHLSFSVPQFSVASFFLGLPSFPLSNLTRLEIRVPFVTNLTPSSVRSILRMLSQFALSLTSLSLNLVPCHTVSAARILRVLPLGLPDLLSVGAFRDLRRFAIYHPCPLSFSDSDFEDFARLLPSAEALDLNSRPTVFRVPSTSMQVLDHFARICLKLEHLSVFVLTLPIVPRVSSSRFSSHFKELDFGRSPLPAADNINGQKTLARYLARVVPCATAISHFVEQMFLDSKLFDVTSNGNDLREAPAARKEIMKARWWAIVVMVQALREAQVRGTAVNNDLRSRVIDLRSAVAALRA